jgi:hypothetical protein
MLNIENTQATHCKRYWSLRTPVLPVIIRATVCDHPVHPFDPGWVMVSSYADNAAH